MLEDAHLRASRALGNVALVLASGRGLTASLLEESGAALRSAAADLELLLQKHGKQPPARP